MEALHTGERNRPGDGEEDIIPRVRRTGKCGLAGPEPLHTSPCGPRPPGYRTTPLVNGTNKAITSVGDFTQFS